MVKKTELKAYKAQRYSKPLVGINLKEDDQVIDVHLTDGSLDVFLITHLGYALWFAEEEISIVGARAAGVKGINLKTTTTLLAERSSLLIAISLSSLRHSVGLLRR